MSTPYDRAITYTLDLRAYNQKTREILDAATELLTEETFNIEARNESIKAMSRLAMARIEYSKVMNRGKF